MSKNNDFFTILQNNSNTYQELSDYINSDYINIYNFLANPEKSIATNLEIYFKNNQVILEQMNLQNEKNLGFILLLYRACMRNGLIMEFNLLYSITAKSHIKIPAIIQIMHDFHQIKQFYELLNFQSDIIKSFHGAYKIDNASISEITYVFVQLYIKMLQNNKYNKTNRVKIYNNFIAIINKKYYFFDNAYLNNISQINIKDIGILLENQQIYIAKKILPFNQNIQVKAEEGSYKNDIEKIENINVEEIRQYCKRYCYLNKDETTQIFSTLDRGTAILQEKEQLYVYFLSFGKKHQLKLQYAYEKIRQNIDNKNIDIIDYGCGQAMATICLYDFIKDNSLNIKINNIILIEPSKIALSRGMLHVNIFDKYPYIKAICKGLNEITQNDVEFESQNTTLHLFSNVLDIETILFDNNFFSTFKNLKGEHIFVCTSPNFGTLRNLRIDMFFNFFKDNYNTKLISKSTDSISYGNNKNASRYEIIFSISL